MTYGGEVFKYGLKNENMPAYHAKRVQKFVRYAVFRLSVAKMAIIIAAAFTAGFMIRSLF